jgi:hypothetical protein
MLDGVLQSITPSSGNNRNGASVAPGTGAGQYNNQSFWAGLGWNFTNVWAWNSTTNLPILRNVGGTQDGGANQTTPTAAHTVVASGLSSAAPVAGDSVSVTLTEMLPSAALQRRQMVLSATSAAR